MRAVLKKKILTIQSWKKTPEIEVVPDVCQVDIADAFLLVDGDVLPVQAYRPLQLDMGQQLTLVDYSNFSFRLVRLDMVRLGLGLVSLGKVRLA